MNLRWRSPAAFATLVALAPCIISAQAEAQPARVCAELRADSQIVQSTVLSAGSQRTAQFSQAAQACLELPAGFIRIELLFGFPGQVREAPSLQLRVQPGEQVSLLGCRSALNGHWLLTLASRARECEM